MANILEIAKSLFHFLSGYYFKPLDDPDIKAQPLKNIVILGGAYAGVGTAHRILKQAAKIGPFKITLVSQNTDFYWSLATPRGIVPGQFPDEKLFQPIAPGFAQYPATQFEFLLATAESVDFDAKKVGISRPSGNGNVTLDYDFLIIATGSYTKGNVPFKGLASTEETKEALHDFQARVQKAKTIVVAGAGVTGVETAGELAFEYGESKKIILIASGPTVLEESPSSVGKYAKQSLLDLKVDLRTNARVTDSIELGNGQHELTLSSPGGGTVTTDIYIPTFGLVPNSSYIPSKYLDAKGFVIVDEYLKVKGAGDVWAIGDINNIEFAQAIPCNNQSVALAKNIVKILSKKAPLPYKPSTSRTMGLQIGKKLGTGHFGNIKIPSFLVVYGRKHLFTEKLQPTVNGSMF